jgi:hypothetical protein
MASSGLPRLIPTGNCWCGCGSETSIGSFFAKGHDKIAEAALLAVQYGGAVAHLLNHHGYGPTRSVTADAVRDGGWVRCPNVDCAYCGTPASVRLHCRTSGH